MRVAAERLRDDPLKLRLDLVDCLAGCQTRAVADPEHVGIDGERLLAERRVEYHIGGLPPDTGQLLKLLASAWDFTSMLVDQRLAEGDDVLCLGIEQADGLDRVTQPFLAEIDHLLRLLDVLEQRPAGDVDARVGRLGREHDGHQQLVGIG